MKISVHFLTRHLELFITLFLVVIFLSNPCFAQTSIDGRVIDEDNKSLPIANILIQGTSEGTSCDENGIFSLTTDHPTPFIIEVSYVGYNTFLIPINRDTSDLVVTLISGLDLTNSVVVSASRKREKIQEAPAAVSIITERTLRSDAVSEPMLSLRNLTGVDVAQYSVSGGQINLRGKSEVFQTETFVIADYRNIVVPSLGFLLYGSHPIDVLDLEKIEVVKGPGSALYGPGVEAGVVHFISKDPFDYEGTSLSIGGGNHNQFVSSFRHAQVLNRKWAYKLTGQFRNSRDFELDPNDPVHAARINGYVIPITSALTGDVVETKVPDYDQQSLGFTGTLVHKPSQKTTIHTVLGYGKYKGLFRTSQGEGYVKSGRPFAQVRVNSGGLFAQAFWGFQNSKDGNSYLYNTGLTTISISHQFESQLQYNFTPPKSNLDLTIGGDLRAVTIDTKNTINGRFEDDDNYNILGIYAQGKYAFSEKWDAIAAGRIDRFSSLDKTSFSPRVGIVYKASPSNTFRLTWNKSFGAPTSLNLYGDTPIANTGTFLIYLLNGVEDLTFNQGNGYNFVTSSTTPGGAIPLPALYGLVTGGLASSGVFPKGLTDYLFSLIPTISGSTNAVLTSAPITRTPLSLSESNVFEFGYKGVIANKWALVLDVYYNNRKNILSAPLPVSPFLIYPSAGPDLAAQVAGAADPAVLGQFGFSPEIIAGIYSSSIEDFTLDDNGAPTPLGILSSDNSPSNVGTYDFAYLNFEELKYWGIDFGIEYHVNNYFSLFGNVSWLSQNFWEDLNLNKSSLSAPLSLNVPDKRIKLGFNINPEQGLFYNASIRIISDWESVNGFSFSGPVNGSNIVDAAVGYNFNKKLQLSINVTNLFDTKYRPIFGAPDITRLILGRIIYDF